MAEEKTNATGIEVFEGSDSQWYYHARAGNNEILNTSEGYTRREDAVRAAEDTYPGVQISVSTTINEETEGGNSMENAPQEEPQSEPAPGSEPSPPEEDQPQEPQVDDDPDQTEGENA